MQQPLYNSAAKRPATPRWQKILLSIIVIGSLSGAFVVTTIDIQLRRTVAKAAEAARPATVTLTRITTPLCSDCFDMERAVATLKQQAITIQDEKTLEYTSADAQALIQRLGIQKVPTYVLNGEVSKNNIADFISQNGSLVDSSFVFTNVTPVYVDTQTQLAVGRATVTLVVDSDCTQCFNIKNALTTYQATTGLTITNQQEVEWDSEEGERLTSLYAITKVPTIILSSEVSSYDMIKNTWKSVGIVASDGNYVLTSVPLPYRDIPLRRVVGMVDVVYLTDSSCSECYNSQDVHQRILKQEFRMGLQSERTVDIASGEGKRLLEQYNITKVPTVLLSKEANAYTALLPTWEQVGTVEEDGRYVFREVQKIGTVTYKDLTSGAIIKPAQQQQNN